MAQQTPYIGSKISLISKLDIRYEGILYTVDTNESTIALAKVQSFGTEDRPTANPVAGRDDIYEYIIFKASDIKDLIVCDTPKPMPQLGGLAYDPAILSVSHVHMTQPTIQSIPLIHPLPPIPSSMPTLANAISAGMIELYARLASGSTTPNRLSPLNEGIAPLSRAPGAGRSQQRALAYPQAPQFEKARGGFAQSNPPPAVHHPSYPPLRPPFESESEKASETSDDVAEVVEEGENGGAAESDETFYDKSSSFFDRISCESLDKEAGRHMRLDWRKERETNQETFGHSAVRSLAYRRGRAFMGPRGDRGGLFRYNTGYNNYGGQHRNYSDHQYAFNRRGGYRNNFTNPQ